MTIDICNVIEMDEEHRGLDPENETLLMKNDDLMMKAMALWFLFLQSKNDFYLADPSAETPHVLTMQRLLCHSLQRNGKKTLYYTLF